MTSSSGCSDISVLGPSPLRSQISVHPRHSPNLILDFFSPGLNLTYAHLLALISREEAKGNDLKAIYVTGAFEHSVSISTGVR